MWPFLGGYGSRGACATGSTRFRLKRLADLCDFDSRPSSLRGALVVAFILPTQCQFNTWFACQGGGTPVGPGAP